MRPRAVAPQLKRDPLGGVDASMNVRYHIILAVALLTAPHAAAAQRAPSAGIAAGLGNPFGWLGVRGEIFVLPGRFSLLAGAGLVPGSHYLHSSIAWAASGRYYVGRGAHRFYADVSWSLLGTYDLLVPGWPEVFDYGLGYSLGYSYLTPAGLRFTVGAGIGKGDHEIVPIVQLGIGWTLYRR